MRVHTAADAPSGRLNAEYFTGDGRMTRFEAVSADPAAGVYRDEFTARARTNWHTHSGTQVLYVVEGRCRCQAWGGPVRVAETGDVVSFAPGEKHWHGADGDAPMAHLAINLDLETEWLEPVSDEQYRGDA